MAAGSPFTFIPGIPAWLCIVKSVRIFYLAILCVESGSWGSHEAGAGMDSLGSGLWVSRGGLQGAGLWFELGAVRRGSHSVTHLWKERLEVGWDHPL